MDERRFDLRVRRDIKGGVEEDSSDAAEPGDSNDSLSLFKAISDP